MSSLSLDMLVSIVASAIIALMVAAGGAALSRLPADVEAEAPVLDSLDPLTVCHDDGERVRCIRVET